jgi:hypothetical protein
MQNEISTYHVRLQGALTDKVAQATVHAFRDTPWLSASVGEIVDQRQFGATEVALIASVASALAAVVSTVIAIYDRTHRHKPAAVWEVSPHDLEERLPPLVRENYAVISVSSQIPGVSSPDMSCQVILAARDAHRSYTIAMYSETELIVVDIQ